MRYFLANLVVHIIMILFLVFMMCLCTQRNRKHQTKYATGCFLPLFFAILAIFWVYFVAGPRLLDFKSVINSNYYSDTGVVTDVSLLKNYFVIDGVCYYMNPLRNSLEAGEEVRIKNTQYSHYTIEITRLDDETSAITHDAPDSGN